MAKLVTINGTVYTLNQEGDSPPYGEQLSDLLQALVDNANATTDVGDISTTSFSVPNSGSTISVTSVAFDVNTVRSAILSYSLYRTTNTPLEVSECGHIYITYKSTAGTWELAQNSVGSAQVAFSITNAGQLQITPTVLSGTGVIGKLKISAKSFTQI